MLETLRLRGLLVLEEQIAAEQELERLQQHLL
jgi:hypothetical protein